jgi:hypothetical protein
VEYKTMTSLSNGVNGYGNAGGQLGGHGAQNVVTLNTAKAIDPADAQMDQIRDLLFGEFKREIDQRLAGFDARLVDLERRLAAARTELASARTEDEGKRKAMLDDIARGVATLGDHVKQISR